MKTFATLIEAILAAEEAFDEPIMISDARGTEIEFKSRQPGPAIFRCSVHDGYLRYLEDGKLIVTKQQLE